METNSVIHEEVSTHQRVLKLMGNRFEISVVSDDEHWAEQRIDDAVEEISRIEQLLTTFKEDSKTQEINQNAGIKPVVVDREIFDLIQRSLNISKLTQGAFDITYGSIDKRLWNFDTNMTSLPDKEIAKSMVRLINYRNVILDSENCSVYLKEKGIRIGFGGIGKGYAADRAKYVMQHRGVTSGIVNASGDLTAWGRQPNDNEWTIGIADPNKKLSPFSFLNITDLAVATSGNYEKYAVIDGKKYSHTINPKTGFPVEGIKSVTTITTNAELADAMATPIMVMGIKAGLNLINQIRNLECIIIDDNGRIYTSANIKVKS
jgi:thiamine biosynthesis lipoprotein